MSEVRSYRMRNDRAAMNLRLANGLRWTRSATRMACLLLCFCASPQTIEIENPLLAQASRIVAWIEQGQAASVAASFHYPPRFSQTERESDSASAARFLESLLREFGAVENTRPLSDPVDMVEIGVSGGDIPYWSSLGEFETRDFVYEVRFQNLGTGLVKVVFFETEENWEVRGVAFGLPLSRTDAVQRVTGIAQRMSEEGALLPGI